MDYAAIIGGAWGITRRYTWLWVLGLLVVGPGSGSVDLTLPSGFGVAGVEEVVPYQALSAIGLIVVTGLLVLGAVGLWLVGVVARGALVVAVDRAAEDEESGLGAAWAGGVAHFGRLFFIGLPAAVPALLLALLAYVAALPGVAGEGSDETLAGVVVLCLLPLCCLLSALSLGLNLVQHFADRAAILEGLGAGAAYRRGWSLLVGNLRQVGALAGMWALLTGIARLLIVLPTTGLILPVLLVGVAGEEVAVGSLAATCLAGFLTVVALLLHAVTGVFTSALWTLAYRSLLGRGPRGDEEAAPAAERQGPEEGGAEQDPAS